MTDSHHDDGLSGIASAVAAPKGRWSLHLVWLVPIVAALIGGWIAVKAILEHGPTITITFRAAEGLEAGKTKIKYKDVDVGEVRHIAISEDLSRVIVTAEMVKSFSSRLVDDTRFWVVRTRIAGGQVSGIGTLFSGSYIGLDVGKSQGSRSEFEGLEAPPIIAGDVAGRQFDVRGPDQGSLDVGAPVYFRRVPVGRVLSSDLNMDGTGVTMKIFVTAPYDRFVSANTRFWNASGIDITLDSSGLKVQTQSLASILFGGMAFETPEDAPTAGEADENASFSLFPDRELAMRRPDKEAFRFAANFTESLRGLTVGSPVEFHGLPLGEVTSIGAKYDVERQLYRFPVEIALYPDRLARHFKSTSMRAEDTGLTLQREINALIDHGLRAQLNTGNLLTGQLFVSLDFFHDAEKAEVDWTKNPPELPTIPGGLSGLQHTLAHFAKKLERLPLDEIAVDLRRVLQSLNKTLRNTDDMVQRLDHELAPKAQETLEEMRRALLSMERLLAADAPLQQDAREALRQLGKASQSFHLLADFLERHPEALIRGKKEGGQ